MRPFSAALLAGSAAAAPCAPAQFWVNYAESPSSMRVSWATACASASTVAYGTSPAALTQTVTGPAGAQYTAPFYTSPFIHHATVTGLQLGTTYYYQVGDQTSGLSAVMNFSSHPGTGAAMPHTFAIIGDPGQTANSASTFAHVSASSSDSVVIVGDLSYADSDQPRWDSFQALIAPLTAHLPTMVMVGVRWRAGNRVRC